MERLERMFKALSDATRLRILAMIFRQGPLCVCEVESLLGITQSKASRHLRYMSNAGVLSAEREGVTVNYGLPEAPDAELAAVLVMLRGLLADPPSAQRSAQLVQIRMARARETGAIGAQC